MTGDHPADDAAADVPDRVLVTALDFAVGIAAAGAQHRPPMPFPTGLRPFLRVDTLTPKAMATVRRAVESDPVFRERLGAVAVPELVDEAGMLWLRRPAGWVERLTELVPAPGEVDTATQLRRSERRREAAEQAARRAIAELAVVRAEQTSRASTVAATADEVAKLRSELEAVRSEGVARQRETRRLTDQLAAARAALADLEARLAVARERVAEAEQVRDQVLGARAGAPAADEPHAVLARAAALASELSAQADRAAGMGDALRRLARSLAELEPVATERRAPVPDRPARRGRPTWTRRPIALPGGVYGSSRAAAEFLVRHAGVVVIVDGYNVAKLGWPTLALDEQRERCIATCEDIGRRFGTDVTIVFDGAGVVGASADRRRLVRVRFSPEGVIADDVIRDEVAALPAAASVVVATNDQAIVADVRAMGANVLTSEQLLELGRR